MSAQYDRERVDSWVEDAKCLDPYELASMWTQLAFFPAEIVDLPPDLYRVWETFSLWEKQHALFELSPVINKIAIERGQILAKEARKKEPL